MNSRLGHITKVICVAAALLALAACDRGPERAPVIGEAYVGPSELRIRTDLPTQSPVAAIVKHGDRVEILQRRRRFLRVRAANGAEGWTEERQLLAAPEMESLKALSERAAAMPAQGQATTYGDLNVHTQPARLSPSFLLVKEEEKVDVLAHVVSPRSEPPRKPLLPPPPPKKAKVAKKEQPKEPKEPKYPLPPPPKPPGAPANWLELSKTDDPDEDAAAAGDEEEEEAAAPPAPATAPTDDWSLVRLPSGQAGWVLTRRLVMAIPDEVAQYAEGHRIVSYFPLGEVRDGEESKKHWLWTTIASGAAPYDFDGFRVFVWSLRRHRYETGYIERNLKGYAPVLLKSGTLTSGTGPQAKPGAATYPGFSVCIEKADGQRYRRDYLFLGAVVKFTGEAPCESKPLLLQAQPSPAPSLAPTAAPQQQESLTQRLKQRFQTVTQGWFGR